MKYASLLYGCSLSALAILSGCNSDSAFIFVGSSAKQPTTPVIESTNNHIALDYCNGYSLIDELDINHNDTIRIIGWATDENYGALSQLLVKVNNKYIAANYGLERVDVQIAFGGSSSAVGFEVSFAKSLLQGEDGYIADHLELIGVTPSGQYAPLSYNFIKEPNLPNVPVHERKEEVAAGGVCMDVAEGNTTINMANLNTSKVLLYGWAFDTETLSHLSGIYAKFGEHMLVGERTERPDVQQAFSLNDSQVGFSFLIPRNLLQGNNELEIYGIGTSGDYLFTQKKYILNWE